MRTFELADIPDQYFPWYGRMPIDLWQLLRRYVYQRDRGKCCYCEESVDLESCHIHHVLQLQDGGTNHPMNLKTVCVACHQQRHKWMLNPLEKIGFSKFLIFITIFVTILYLIPILGYQLDRVVIGSDWVNTFCEGAKNWKAPWEVGLAAMYPQWVMLILYPLTLLPTHWGHGLIAFLSLVIFTVYVKDWWRALLLVLSFPVCDMLIQGQLEGILVLAFMVPLKWGIVIASLKPPFLLGWVFAKWMRSNRPWAVIIPMVCVLMGSLILWGWWPGKLSFDQLAAPISIDLWPWGVPIGLGLLFTENPGLWLLAGCLMTPYLLFHHLTPMMAWIYKRKSPAFLLCLTILSWVIVGISRRWW